ncbi:MAG: 16S rRNA (guanine(527)-N(7))-methyltransferase RsmG [Rhodobacteraceae bacterium]|nr:16S rRNA (guanine(527)-N(7))-methyltransferase RsmG [Paracoccaceae bacterium]
MSDVLARLNVSRETTARLRLLGDMLAKWNPAINLVAKSTLADAWSRHILDSAQIYALAPVGDIWADLGSGGGFPGLVVAALAAELHPGRQVILVESDQRKSTFLRQAAREMGVSAQVISDRIEQIAPLGADVLSARALAALPQLCEFAALHLKPGGVALFPKGASWQDEVAQAGQQWRYDLGVFPSETDPLAVILTLKALEHV